MLHIPGVMNDGGTCIIFKLNMSEDASNYTSYDLVFQVNQVMSLSLIRDNLKVTLFTHFVIASF